MTTSTMGRDLVLNVRWCSRGGSGKHDRVGRFRVCLARECGRVCVRACGWARVCLRSFGMFVCIC